MKSLDKIRVFIIICILVCIVLLSFFMVSGVSLSIENNFYYKISEYMSPALTIFQKLITNVGSAIFIIIFCLMLLVIKKTRKKVGIIASVTVITSSFFNMVLKNIFGRQRPSINQLVIEEGFSFPSGHSMVNAALYTMLILLICKYVKSRKIKVSLITLCVITPTLIGLSRIYLGVHYLIDVLVGWLFGILIAILIDIAFEKYFNSKKEIEEK